MIGSSPECTGHWPKPQNTKVLECISDMGLLQNSSHYEMGMRGVKMLSVEKWPCAEKGDWDRAKGSGCFGRENPGHLVNQSIRSLAFREFDFAGKRKL